MKLTIDQLLQQALTTHQQGKFEEAERLYREILKNQSTNFIALNNLSIILKKSKKFEEAEANLKKVIELKPNFAEGYNNLGNIILEHERLEEAETCFKKAIELKADYADAHNNMGVTLNRLERIDEAVVSFKKAIELKPDFADAHNNMGISLNRLERLEEAEVCFKKAIEIKADYTKAYSNLGNTLYKLGRLDEAETSFKKAIELKPDCADAYNDLGSTLHKLQRIDEAVVSFKKAIELKPDFADCYNNLGRALNNKGDLLAALDNFKKAINIKPDFAQAWYNIFFPLQAIKFQEPSVNDHFPLLGEQVTSKYAQTAKFILNYCLNLGSPSKASSLNEALKVLSSADNNFIKNPKVPSSELIQSTLPKKITALIHFGRSGTGLLHSLIDGHPEISTLPSIYFSEFFDYSTWEKITIGGWEEMADRFTTIYDVLFDASSFIPVSTVGGLFIRNLGKDEGMMNVGKERGGVLSIDKKVFIKELKRLMEYHDRLDQFTFFKLIHSAYEITLQNPKDKKHIFYHIHNPAFYAQLNFFKSAPNTNWLTMVREPLQSCESWIRNNFHDNDYTSLSGKIFQMLFQIDNIILQNKHSIGVRLEDLKEHPKKTIKALCSWLGIKEKESLYQMTAQGKKWWGDPSSPDFREQGNDPFEKSSINRKLGSVFSKNDQFILSTLFYPFSVHFGYAEENLEQFKKDLQTVRPMLDQMFDFEKKIAQNTNMNMEKFMKSGTYLFLRSGMIERWNTLNKFHTYPNMLTLMKVN